MTQRTILPCPEAIPHCARAHTFPGGLHTGSVAVTRGAFAQAWAGVFAEGAPKMRGTDAIPVQITMGFGL
eukprot:gene9682-biopygen15262